ncbi:MAG: hypothetical protein EBU90_12720 [Proteobacteria bacterium]|nr:hypothetical protein [Pseudomonadota bacterium]NBP14835.1 hypothetical protein [bacterium]
MLTYKIRLLFSLVLLVPQITFTHAHFYHASGYPFGTRYERKGLLTLDAWGAHGNTRNGKDGDGKRVNVLGIYGNEKMHQLGKNVENQNLSAISQDILDTLWRHTPTTEDSNYATLKFTGKCNYSGGAVTVAVNLTDEFFIGSTLPFYKIRIQTPTFVDLTAEADKDAEWNQFYAYFDTILADSNLSRQGHTLKGIGDVSVFAGWTRSTDTLDNLDYLDATIKLGGLLGTAAAKDENYAFSIAPGYDKHKGMFLGFDMAFGFGSYYSFGFHLQETFLFKRSKLMRIQSALGQNGFIKLAKAQVNRTMGNLYEVGGHFKIEYGTALFYTGYTYSHKGNDSLVAQNSALYPGSVINEDSMLKDWSTHVVHVGAEFDFANSEEQRIHPKFGIGYNHIVRARRAFENHTVTGSVGFSITSDF